MCFVLFSQYITTIILECKRRTEQTTCSLKATTKAVTYTFSLVTVARAVELKHKASLISALTNETSKLFTAASMFFVS